MDTFELIKTIGAITGPIIAAISLGWQILKARAEHLAKPKVMPIVSNPSIEIGYTLFGPVMSLSVSYRTEVRNAFVERVEAVFRNIQTNKTHVLEVRDFLEYRHDPTGQMPFPRLVLKEPFAPFGLSTDRYENKTLLFYDPKCSEILNAEQSKLLPTVLGKRIVVTASHWRRIIKFKHPALTGKEAQV